MKKILVTGGLGFIGYHLVKYLLTKYNDSVITIIDNLSSTIIDFSLFNSKLNVIIDDILNIKKLYNDYDYIYHLASPVGSLGILKKNGIVAKEIINLTYKIIKIAEKNSSRLLFVSSSEVYGRSGVHNENSCLHIQNLTGTRAEYALGKLLSEIILNNIKYNKNISYNIVRPFNVIGEYQSSNIGFVVPTFFEKSLDNLDLPIFYNGLQKRSFCYIMDIVEAMVLIQESNIEHEVFNIGNDNNIITILDLAKNIRSLCSSNSKIIHINPQKKYGMQYIEAFDKIPDINKMKRYFNWIPKYELNESLNIIYNCYKNKNENIISKSII